MKLNAEQIQKVMDMELKELYNYLKALTGTYPELTEVETTVTKGIKIKFPIHYYIHRYYLEKPKNKKVSIQGYGTHDINEFHKEISDRETMIREAILELQPEELFEKR